jgi:hypothetical protein
MGKTNKTAVFDFDGVIATYDGFKGFDILGEPIEDTIQAMRDLKERGYYLVVFTTRPATQILVDWLKKNKVPYDDLNRNTKNPMLTSNKPIADVYIDDRAVRYSGQSKAALLTEILAVAEKEPSNQFPEGQGNG